MRNKRRTLWLLAVVVATLLIVDWGRRATAAEPAEAFLQGLQDRGLDDMAMAYLEQMRASRLCPPEFKKIIDYKAGVTLVIGARSIRSTSERAKRLDLARSRLEKFLADNPHHDLASSATTQLANVLVERGRMLADESERASKTAAEKKQLLAAARGFYGKAKDVFVKAEKHYGELLEKLPTGLIDRKDVELIETRSRIRTDLMQARLLRGTAIYETAMTHAADSKQRKDLLAEAAQKYNDLYEKYGTWLVGGLYARMWEGRCYKELGDHDKALQIYDGLLAKDEGEEESGALRRLRNKVLILMLETSLQPKVKQYKAAIDNAGEWLQSIRGDEQSSPDGLAIKYLAGGAFLQYARGMEEDDAKRRKSIKQARELFQFVSRFPSDYQRPAKSKLADPLLGSKKTTAGEPSTFAEARERGKAALDRMQAVDTQDKLDLAAGKSENHRKNVKEIAALRDEAIEYYRMALGMISSKTSVEDINVVRYYLAYLHWTAGDAYRAAVLGEFLATRYPQSVGARQGAKIAMAAYAKLFNRAEIGSPTRQFANARMVKVADYITRRWPDGSEAGDAWMMLLRTAVMGGSLQEASGFLAKVPAASSRRGEAELMVGRAYWADYLRCLRLEEESRPEADVMAENMAAAKKLLGAGIEHSRGKAVDASLFAAVLSLAQIHLRDGNPADAVKVLDDPKVGAHTLMKQKHPASQKPGYDIETYKTALRAYVAARELEKAEKAMDALEKAVAADGDAKAASKLTRIYISLGRELQELLEGLREQGKTDELAAVSGGFELFLNRISGREQGNNFNSLNWVAETFLGMGSGFDPSGQTPGGQTPGIQTPGGQTLPPEAEKYYAKAAATYRTILKKCKDDKSFAPKPNIVYGIRVRLAKCLLRLGQYETAMKFLASVLAKKNMMVDAQVQAAHTYQAWAATPGNASRYRKAIKGGYRSKKTNANVVWGWLKISKMVASSKKHSHVFHEARYNLALCQMEAALMLRGQKKKNGLAAAEKSITRIHLLYPKMGGAQWRGKYDTLLRKIQKLQGKPATGLGKPKNV